MNTFKKQRGLSALSWLLILVIAGFFLLCAFKIIPLYAENRYVESALNSLIGTSMDADELTDGAIRRKLADFYQINGVRSEGPQNIAIQRDAKGFLVTIDYEARTTLFDDVPLLRTLDVVVLFENHLDSTDPKSCCRPKRKK